MRVSLYLSLLRTIANETTHFSISYIRHFPTEYIQFLQNENCKTATVAGLLREIEHAVKILTTLNEKEENRATMAVRTTTSDLSLSQLATFD